MRRREQYGSSREYKEWDEIAKQSKKQYNSQEEERNAKQETGEPQ